MGSMVPSCRAAAWQAARKVSLDTFETRVNDVEQSRWNLIVAGRLETPRPVPGAGGGTLIAFEPEMNGQARLAIR